MIDEEPDLSSQSEEEDESDDGNITYEDDLDNPFNDNTLDDADDQGPTQTSFDHYFTLVNRKLETSSNVFSRAVPPIDRETFFNTAQTIKVPKETQASLDALHSSFQKMMPNYPARIDLGL